MAQQQDHSNIDGPVLQIKKISTVSLKHRITAWHAVLTVVIVTLLIYPAVSGSAAPSANLTETTSPASQTGRIVVTITNINRPGGVLGILLHNSKKGFPGKHELALVSQQKKYSGNSDRVVFENIPYGTYAISVAHDENGNGKLDANFIGIPKEGVGVSNNPKIGMGGPKFDQCSFTLGEQELAMTILMKYL